VTSLTVDSRPLRCPAGDAAWAGGCAYPACDRTGEAPRGDRGGRKRNGRSGAGAAELVRSARSGPGARLPPCRHDGTERRIRRPQDPTEQTRCDRGQKTCHTVNNVRLINAALAILFLRETHAGSTHERRIADGTPYP
jgi:hypothetical protein